VKAPIVVGIVGVGLADVELEVEELVANVGFKVGMEVVETEVVEICTDDDEVLNKAVIEDELVLLETTRE